MLEEFMTWHAPLLQSIVVRNNDPRLTIARKLSDLNEKEWQEKRRRQKYEAKQQIKQGCLLAEQRDSGKRKFDDANPTEQQLIDDIETEKSRRRY